MLSRECWKPGLAILTVFFTPCSWRTSTVPLEIDPDQSPLDLVLVREVDIPPALVWRAWTEPELLKRWYTPDPWQTTECEIDLRPGGRFRTVMRGPKGEMNDSTGCFLEVVPNQRLVFTDALGPGFRPNASVFMTGVISLEEIPGGTRYTARAMHKDQADRDTHEAMGFEGGWGTALSQLVAVMKGER